MKISGGTDGTLTVWKIPSDVQLDEDINPQHRIKISKDCVNGVNIHKTQPILAVSLGQRICDEEGERLRDNGIRFYWLGR